MGETINKYNYLENLDINEFKKPLNEMNIDQSIKDEINKELKNFNNMDIEEVFAIEDVNFALEYTWQQGSWVINKTKNIPHIKNLFRKLFSEGLIKVYRGITINSDEELSLLEVDKIIYNRMAEFLSTTTNKEVARKFAYNKYAIDNKKYVYSVMLEVEASKYYKISHRDMNEDEIIITGECTFKLIHYNVMGKDEFDVKFK